MAFQMSYTSSFSSTPYSASYWVCTSININPDTLNCTLLFQGWASKTDHDNKLPSIPGANKSYQIPAATLESFNTANNINIASTLAIPYTYALQCDDTNGASYFANATQV